MISSRLLSSAVLRRCANSRIIFSQRRTFETESQKSAGAEGRSIIVVVFFAGAAFLDAKNNFEISRKAYVDLLDNAVMPILRLMDAETAHNISIKAASYRLTPRDRNRKIPILETTVFGLRFDNAIGLAAGYDKNAEAMNGLFDMGFGFIEIGTVTPEPQKGNERPRMFRLLEDEAIINRCGFNNDGAAAVEQRLAAFRSRPSSKENRLLGINVGKNKWVTEDQAADDYCAAIRKLAQYGDFIVVNISSPNTPGLRLLQRQEAMTSLVTKCSEARDDVSRKIKRNLPLLVKIAPDLSEKEKRDIAEVALGAKVDGLVVSNTTVERPDTLRSQNRKETGGLSGAPLRDASTRLIHEMYELTGGRVPLIGVGGVGSGRDAYEKICAGASLVQMYSMLVYNGPGSVQRAKSELAQIIESEGFENVSQAVGSAHRKSDLRAQRVHSVNAD